MTNVDFQRPVAVLVGLGFPRAISNVLDAIRFLDEQASSSRDEAYQATYAICRDALAGSIGTQEAYDAISAFARRRGIFVEDAAIADPAATRQTMAA